MENTEEFKKLTMNLMKLVMDSGRPKPTTTHGACDMCAKRTKHYHTDYPKGKKLWWRCNKCVAKHKKENCLTEEEFFKILSR